MSASIAEITQFMDQAFPDHRLKILAANNGEVELRYDVSDTDLRPGGTVSGPTLMGLADAALYIAIFSAIGITPLAVTTNLNVNFMRKPKARTDLIARCTLFKVGKSQAVGEVSLFSEGSDEMVAHATGTYMLPSQS